MESTMAKSKAKSWRDVLPVHEVANLFPLMTKPQLQKLADDISANGLKLPVILWAERRGQQKFLLDGRNRLDAMELAGLRTVDSNGDLTTLQGLRWEEVYGLQPIIKLVAGNAAATASHAMKQATDPWLYAMSANILRRHLTTEQRRELISKLLKVAPTKSDRQIAEMAKASHQTVGTVRAKMETKGEVAKLTTRVDRKGVTQPVKRKSSRKSRSSSESKWVRAFKQAWPRRTAEEQQLIRQFIQEH
jgi:hypothetical protein